MTSSESRIEPPMRTTGRETLSCPTRENSVGCLGSRRLAGSLFAAFCRWTGAVALRLGARILAVRRGRCSSSGSPSSSTSAASSSCSPSSSSSGAGSAGSSSTCLLRLRPVAIAAYLPISDSCLTPFSSMRNTYLPTWRLTFRHRSEEFLSGSPDVARAQRQRHIARFNYVQQGLFAMLDAADVARVPMPEFLDLLCQRLRGDAGNRVFARGVNVAQQHDVGVVKRPREIFAQRGRPRVAVRLEEHDQTTPAVFSRGQRRANLGRVVAVIVDYQDAVLFTFDNAFDLESSLGAPERLQPFGDDRETDLEIESDRHRRQRIEHVVFAGHVEFDPTQRLALAPHDELRAETFTREPHVGGRNLGVRPHPVSDHPPLDLRNYHLNVRVVQADDHRAVERDLVDELREAGANLLDPRIKIEVFEVDVRDDGDGRREFEEALVAFIGLDDHKIAAAQLGVAADGIHAPAYDYGRVEPGAVERGRHHRSRGRLAVRAGDGDAVLQPHQLGQHLGARYHGNLATDGLDDLWVVGPHSSRSDDDLRVADIFRVVAFEDLRPHAPQSLGDRRQPRVGAGDVIAEVKQHFGYAAHPDAADAHEMNVLILLEHSFRESGVGRGEGGSRFPIPHSLLPTPHSRFPTPHYSHRQIDDPLRRVRVSQSLAGFGHSAELGRVMN